MTTEIPEEYRPAGTGLDLAPFHRLVSHLRHPELGCPWDKSRTLEKMAKTIREEAEETAVALEKGDFPNQAEELGDILLNVMLAVIIAEEEGRYTWKDVVDGVSAKLIRRHPHVFGDTPAASAEEATRMFLAAKAKEKEKSQQ